ncbi:carboxypeptidase regulatory-like domain-containing protein [Lentimicrobium sp. S6]|uniref:carboxypeptidase regulatory-like domain-containing protein n=1 Tax=Lentimicrobium sp. S6 TaxID=2735872 RepID=UPI001552C561|nr:carboxypeptidase regulatory-like domain-containing protein [Lentimicrobium sp. S6]NPD48145.1 hypothetical protein [Lentimicrobium sp. S6]
MKQNVIFFLFLLLISFSCKKEKEIELNGHIEGYIQNVYGQKIEGVLLKLDSYQAISDSLGHYSFNNLATNTYTLSVTKEGYVGQSKSIFVEAQTTTNQNFELLAGNHFLNISDSLLIASSNDSSLVVEIQSSTEWSVLNSSSWLSSEITSGFGNMELVFNYSENMSSESRIDTIKFVSGNIVKKLVIKQYAKLRVVKYVGIPGNDELNMSDSVYILFNRPINVNKLEAPSNYEPDLNYVYTDDNHGIMFDYAGGYLGWEVPFKITVSDNDNQEFSEELVVPFYTQKLKTNGEITDFLLINEDKEVLIAIYNPSVLIKYSLELDSVLHIYDLSSYLAPIKLTYNDYNSLVYLVGSYPNIEASPIEIDRPDVYTLDLQSNSIEHAFKIEPLEEEHPNNPSIYPMDMAFTKLGSGLIILKNDYYSGFKVRIIDNTINDTIYPHPEFEFNEPPFFVEVYPNYNKTKLYLNRFSSKDNFGIYDGFTKEISILPHEIVGSPLMVPNQKSENFFVGMVSNFYLLDLENNESEKISISSCSNPSADFIYSFDNENLVYLHGSNYFRILDLNSGEVISSCQTVMYFNDLTTTIDGKYCLATKENSDDTFSLIITETSILNWHLNKR